MFCNQLFVEPRSELSSIDKLGTCVGGARTMSAGRRSRSRRRKRVALYLRVSTGEQTTRSQRRELEAVARRQGWTIVTVYEDAGISGARAGISVRASIL